MVAIISFYIYCGCLSSPVDSASVVTLKKSKTLDAPLKKPQKTPGQISMQLAYNLGKNPTFPGENPTFSEKSSFSPPKFLMTFSLVINSDFQIFTLLLTKKLRKQQLIANFFSQKNP